MDKKELAATLDQFTGTEAYFKWSNLFPNFVLTDGTRFLAQEAGAFWLMDLFASHYRSYRDEGFAAIKVLRKDSGDVQVLITDGNDHILAEQDNISTDFPLDDLTLYAAPADENLWVIMLTSEY